MIRLARSFAAGLAVLLASCSSGAPPPTTLSPAVVRSLQQYTREYVLQPGDQIEVSVLHVPDLLRTVTVRPDGDVTLPMVKNIKVAGQSIPELSRQLERRYAERLVDPDVTVNVLNPRAASVLVLGEVQRSGPVPLRDAPTAALALAAAGGITRSAGLDSVVVIHLREDGILEGTLIDRQGSGEAGFYTALSNMPVSSGDLVVVPESGRSQAVRFIQDFINTPLTSVNQALTPYYQFRLINALTK